VAQTSLNHQPSPDTQLTLPSINDNKSRFYDNPLTVYDWISLNTTHQHLLSR